MNDLNIYAPEYYTFTFKVRTVEYDIHYIKIVATTHDDAFSKLFRYSRHNTLHNSPVTTIINVEPYAFK